MSLIAFHIDLQVRVIAALANGISRLSWVASACSLPLLGWCGGKSLKENSVLE
jgi:hypothetical protein